MNKKATKWFYFFLGLAITCCILYGILLLQPTIYSLRFRDQQCWTFGFAGRDTRFILTKVHPDEKAKRRRALIREFLVKSRFLDLHNGVISSDEFIVNTTNMLFQDSTYEEIKDNYLIVYPEQPLDFNSVLMIPSYGNDSGWPIVLVDATMLPFYIPNDRKVHGHGARRRIKIPRIVTVYQGLPEQKPVENEIKSGVD